MLKGSGDKKEFSGEETVWLDGARSPLAKRLMQRPGWLGGGWRNRVAATLGISVQIHVKRDDHWVRCDADASSRNEQDSGEDQVKPSVDESGQEWTVWVGLGGGGNASERGKRI